MEALNLSFGENLKSNDAMGVVALKYIVDQIQASQSDLKTFTERLRAVASIDSNAYRRLKTRLPYFCGSIFQGGVRRQTEFIAASALIIDLDNLDTDQIQSTLQTIRQDEYVFLAYVSPSGRGIKVLLSFDHAINDPDLYRTLYPYIAKQFAMKHNCLNHADLSLFDTTRVSFLCHDPEVYFNQNAKGINISEQTNQLRADEIIKGQQSTDISKSEVSLKRVDDSVFKEMASILRKKTGLNANTHHVPVCVNDLVNRLEEVLPEIRLMILERRAIHYGIKLRVRHVDGAEGEVNIYHGQRGYSFIPSPRAGANHALNELLVERCRALLDYSPHLTMVR
jgi:hypothetical protein